jgi:DNA replication and repair protein RecF
MSFENVGCLIVGKNGIGKTNLLDAISYFTYGRSILSTPDGQLINYQKDFFSINSKFYLNNYENEFKVYYTKDKKVIQVEGKPLKKLSDLYQLLQVIYSSPDDIFNIFSTPAKRRQFLDMAISKIYPAYIDYLRRFKETLMQRNAMLKTDFSANEKEAWDHTFVQEAKNVVGYRLKFFELYKEAFKTAYAMIIDNAEETDVSLKLSFYHEDFESKMKQVLRDSLSKEKKYQESIIGPHRDDFFVMINDKNAFYNASQGQKRSIVIAMKIALGNIITRINNIRPIMIFDDTLAELDNDRTKNLLSNLTPYHQIFIASPTRDKYMDLKLPVYEL